ncbi:MAG: tetratricopeptide repeat protein [Desulfuromonadales bacterium]|nr:tetratricopeptide repeat protein [Desulfuromonadales bacterium]
MYQNDTIKTLADAREFFKQKAYPEALEICQTLLERNGAQPDVLTLQALVHKQSGNLEAAGKSMEQALEQAPDNPGMLFTASLINRQLENFDLAKMQALKAAREAPDNPQIICQCALIVGNLGEPEGALKLLEKFIDRNKTQPEPWYLVGKFQHGLANDQAAEFALRKCLALKPDHATAQKLLDAIAA